MRFRPPKVAMICGRRRLLVLTALLIAAFVALASDLRPVFAHARLIDASPPSGIALTSAPSEIVLTFSEEIDLQYSAASLLTVFDEQVLLGPLTTTNSGRTLHLPIADATLVSPGTYILVWRVLSGVDGHVTTGTVTFSAGTGVAPAAGTFGNPTRPPWWRIAIRWGEIGGLVILLGSFSVVIFVARRPSATPIAGRPLLRATVGVLTVSILLAGYDLGLSATGSSYFRPPGVSTYRDLIANSTTGRSWLTIAVCAGVMSALAFRISMRVHLKVVGFAAGLIALFSLSYAGHAAATDHPWRSIAIDWMHFSTVACWFGSLPFLWLGLRSTSSVTNASSLEHSADAIGRFSRLGLALMGAIIATGFLRAFDQVSGTRTLVDADYGRVLIAKHLLLVPVLVAASANVLVIVPRMRNALSVNVPTVVASTMRSARRFITAEIVAAICILLAAAALTELPPADGPLAVDVASRPTTIDQQARAGDLSIWLLGRLEGDANDRYTLSISDSYGRTLENLQRVIVQTSTQINGEQVGDRFDALPLSGSVGVYAFPALRLGLKGLWSVEIIARRAGVEDVSTTLQIDTSNSGTQPPRLVEDSWRLPRVQIDAGLLFACSIIVLIGGVVAVRRLPGVEPFAVAIIMTMVALITAGFAVQGYRRAIPVNAGTNLVNPVIADPGSIQRGAGLYASLCLQCHGPGGVGIDEDDPEHPHSGGTNLTDRATAKQRDGDLYWSITNGIGGTDMPAFDAALSDNERWDLVNYLRLLQDEPVATDDTK